MASLTKGWTLCLSNKLHGILADFIKSFISRNTKIFLPLLILMLTKQSISNINIAEPTFQVAGRWWGRWKTARYLTALLSTWLSLFELCDFFDIFSSQCSHSPKLIYSACRTVILLLYTTLKTLELCHFHLCKRCRISHDL